MERPIFVIAGILLIALAIFLPRIDWYLATVVIDTDPPDVGWTAIYIPVYDPASLDYYVLSEDKDNPSGIPDGEKCEIYAEIIEEAELKSVQVRITGDGYDSGWLDMTEYYYEATLNSYDYVVEWTIPAGGGVTYTFTFKARDAVNEQIEYRYAITEVPTGYFKIQGQAVTKESVIYTATLDIKFEFIATAYGYMIDEVTVVIRETYPTPDKYVETITLKEVEIDKRWELTHTFPYDGKFDVKGYIAWDTKVVRLMSLALDTGVEIPVWIMTRVVMGLIGFGLIIYGIRRRE